MAPSFPPDAAHAVSRVVTPIKRGDDLEEWFDRELRPVLLHLLDGVRRQAETDRDQALAALRHWAGELPNRAAQQGEPVRAYVTSLAEELRGFLR